MQNANATDTTNLRAVTMHLRDKKSRQYFDTTIYVSDDDQRSDLEIAQEYKENLKASRELHQEKLRLLKLSKNATGTPGPVYRWEYKDPSNQNKLDLEESINAIQQYMPA